MLIKIIGISWYSLNQLQIRKEDIKTKLASIRSELIKTIEKISSEDLNKKVSFREGSWNILEVIKHLYEAEKGMILLMKGILQGGEGVPEDFDLNRYNRRSVEKIQDKTIEILLSDFNESRNKLNTLITGLTEEDLNKKGRHGTLKILTIEEILNLIGDHERSHLDKIKEVIKI